MENKDYVFHVNWEDRHKQVYKIGILAQLDEYFYLIFKEEDDVIHAAKNGFIGIPGFRAGEVYRSQELFDFFKSRILQKDGINPCEELEANKGKSMIDSFSVQKISDRVTSQYKKVILEAYELQERKKQLEEKKEVNEDVPKKQVSDDEFRDVK